MVFAIGVGMFFWEWGRLIPDGRLGWHMTARAFYVELIVDVGSTNRISGNGSTFQVLISLPLCQT
jgi:hypothetical protein